MYLDYSAHNLSIIEVLVTEVVKEQVLCCLLSDSSWEKKIHDLEKGGRIDN